MQEKTRILELQLFLASEKLTIKIDKPMTVGRSQGDVIIEDDELLSAIHCEINPMMLDLYIKDLGSSNGVFVNKQKIFPNQDVKLKAGDEVGFGSHRFIFIDDEEELKKRFPNGERRKFARASKLWAPINFLNFFYAPNYWKAFYFVVILLTIRSFVGNAHLESPLPAELQFLSRLYHEQIFVSGVKVTFFVWAFSLVHSFMLSIYFNRNILRKIASFSVYVVVLGFAVNFIDGPMWNIKAYIESREAIKSDKSDEKSIVRLKKILDNKEVLRKAYNKTMKQIDEPSRKVMASDYKDLMKSIRAKTLQVGEKSKKP